MTTTTNFTPTLAKTYNHQDPIGWLISEKLDGVRAIWTGTHFISRNGNTFPAPNHIINSMPKNIILDGELFGGRATFQNSVGNIRKGNWDNIEFVIFDCITPGDYPTRITTAHNTTLPPFARILQQTPCKNKKHLKHFEETINNLGGEGIILRNPTAPYEHKRSTNLLKIKKVKHSEAIITGYQAGKGRHTGRIGALIATHQGNTFKIGTGLTDQNREYPPAIGETITFSYFEMTNNGKPRFPTFISARNYE